jgi:hypothetical protein
MKVVLELTDQEVSILKQAIDINHKAVVMVISEQDDMLQGTMEGLFNKGFLVVHSDTCWLSLAGFTIVNSLLQQERE